MIPQQIENVGDGRQRIVDFMRDDSGHAAHRSQFLRLAQGVFGAQLEGDVAIHFKNRVSVQVGVLWQSVTILFPLFVVCVNRPCHVLPLTKLLVDLLNRNGKYGLQQRVKILPRLLRDVQP